MSLDGWAERQLLEMVAVAYEANPEASRREVAETVLDRIGAGDSEEYEALVEVVEAAGPLAVLEAIAGRYVCGTRRPMKRALLAGQTTDAALSEVLPKEVARGVMLLIPIGGGRNRKKAAIKCTREEVEAAMQYYAEQKASIGQHEAWCGAIVNAFDAADLAPGATVRDLYAA